MIMHVTPSRLLLATRVASCILDFSGCSHPSQVAMVVTRRMLSVTAAASPGSPVADVRVEETVVAEGLSTPRKRRKLAVTETLSRRKATASTDVPEAGQDAEQVAKTPKGKKTKAKLLATLHTEETLPPLQKKAGKVRGFSPHKTRMIA